MDGVVLHQRLVKKASSGPKSLPKCIQKDKIWRNDTEVVADKKESLTVKT